MSFWKERERVRFKPLGIICLKLHIPQDALLDLIGTALVWQMKLFVPYFIRILLPAVHRKY